jgi:hypothetical protein
LTQGRSGLRPSSLCPWQANPASTHLRRALAFPLYVIALAMSFASDLLGVIAAKIAGDE